jgi:hypothetical protein
MSSHLGQQGSILSLAFYIRSILQIFLNTGNIFPIYYLIDFIGTLFLINFEGVTLRGRFLRVPVTRPWPPKWANMAVTLCTRGTFFVQTFCTAMSRRFRHFYIFSFSTFRFVFFCRRRDTSTVASLGPLDSTYTLPGCPIAVVISYFF